MADRERAPAIVWFRRDLRLSDHPALTAAVRLQRPVLPVFILAQSGVQPAGGASRWWLHGSLESLQQDLAAKGARLVLRSGDPLRVLGELASASGAAHLYFNRDSEPDQAALEQRIDASLQSRLEVRSFSGDCLFEPGSIRSSSGTAFRVFSPFWRACRLRPEPAAPEPVPARLRGFEGALRSDLLGDWHLRPSHPDWAAGLREHWTPGEGAGARALDHFIDERLAAYALGRERLGENSTSRLSPHLHFGELSARQVWHAIGSRIAGQSRLAVGAEAFLRQIGWREFSRHLLHAFPALAEAPLDPAFARFPWRHDPERFRAWTRGLTGYPLVDAGMRELWHTGWMHNRARMTAASFLVKHLLLDWREGERWFRDTLVDADLANNAASWQWVAGCGADAAPWFRIFNPVLQGRKFDPAGDYVRRWVPELGRLPAPYIHKPWAAPLAVQQAAGLKLGESYPWPIVEHDVARARALAAYADVRAQAHRSASPLQSVTPH